jgi:integrase
MFLAARGPTFASAALSYMQAGGERRHLPELLTHFGETPLSRIGQAEIDTAATVLFPDRTNATRNRCVYTPISAVMRHAGHVIVLRRPKGGYGQARTRWLKPDEAKALLEAATSIDARFGAFCSFLLYTGCRLGEAVNLRPGDLHLAEGFAYVRETKNGDPRPVHIPAHVTHLLTTLPTYPLTVFGMSHRRHAALMLNEAFARAGLPKPEGVAFHLFRHTYGAWMRRYAGLDTAALVATGAWKSRNAASVYEHTVTSEEARKADMLPV